MGKPGTKASYLYVFSLSGRRLNSSSISLFPLSCLGANHCVQLDKSGWAWLVAGSKLLLWRHTSQQLTVSISIYMNNQFQYVG